VNMVDRGNGGPWEWRAGTVIVYDGEEFDRNCDKMLCWKTVTFHCL